MADKVIKIKKEDINISQAGEDIVIECGNLDLIFTPEALDKFIEDYTSICNEIKIYSEEYSFGLNAYYKKGDICVWKGGNPCIFRINKFNGRNCYSSTSNTHDSLNFRHIRPATKKEIELLGDKNILFISKSKL